MSYSTEFREEVLDFLAQGNTIESACDLFTVRESSIGRWKQMKNKKGNVVREPRPQMPYKIDNEKLKNFIAENPDAYLNEIALHFGVSDSGICRALRRLNITRKKSRHSTLNEMK